MAEMEEKFFQLIIRPFKACLNFPFLYVLFEAVHTERQYWRFWIGPEPIWFLPSAT